MRWHHKLSALLVLGFVLAVEPNQAEAITAKVQECVNSSGSAGVTIVCTFGAVTAGNVIACASGTKSTSVTVSWGDAGGNSYTSRANVDDATTPYRLATAYALVGTGGAAFTVTATSSGSTNWRDISCQEISGQHASAPDDGFAGQAQTGITTTANMISSTAITTTVAGDYIWAATTNSDLSCIAANAGSGYTQDTNTGCNPHSEHIANQGAAGSTTATFTAACCSGLRFITVIQAFKPASAAASSLRGMLLGVYP